MEVRVSFTVKAVQNQDHGGSTASIANKNKHKGKIHTNKTECLLNINFHDLHKRNDNCVSQLSSGSLQSLNKAAANLGGSLLNIGSKVT